jgi:AmiR/NasT family two-component response regulator
MRGAKVCLAMLDSQEMEKMQQFLQAYGFQVVDMSSDGSSAIRRIRTLRPDLIITDFNLHGISGEEIARIAEEDHIAPAIIIRPNEQISLWNSSDRGWDFAYLYRPISKSALIQTIQLAFMNYKKVEALQGQINKLKGDLESRRLVEKAKGILMEKHGLPEQEAYRRMQKNSMDKGLSMKELAQAIITASEMDGIL